MSVSDHVYQISEITGSSRVDINDAIRSAISKTSESVRHVEWFEIVSTRGHIVDGAVAHFQVTLKVGSRLE
jgi:flavin-binding protein dodecin